MRQIEGSKCSGTQHNLRCKSRHSWLPPMHLFISFFGIIMTTN